MPPTDEYTANRRPDVAELARLISLHAPYDGIFPLRVADVDALRRSHTAGEVAQGAKSVGIGDTVYRYGAGQIAVFSIDVPVTAQLTRASHAEPYLTLRIGLDPEKVATLAAKVYPHGLPPGSETRAVYIGEASEPIVDAANRLLQLMAQPVDAELLAPLTIDEILIRLLRGPLGARVAQIGHAESSLQKMAKAVSWLRAHYDQPVNVEELAALVNMSISSFHRQFKSVTSMSPLHYQKALRLQEARRLMLTARLDAGSAGRRVGYVSASQFSREYARFFGAAPMKDVRRLREQHIGSNDALA
jgi:AraC-like DNA-binding protein